MSDQAEKLRNDVMIRDLSEPLRVRNKSKGNCKVLTVSSGKGGVGKTSLTLNLGLALTRMGCRVIIIDADFGLANIDIMINTLPRYNLGDLFAGRKNIREIMVTGPQNIQIIPGGSGLFDLANLDRARRQILLDQLSDLESDGDYILIDTAAGISRNVTSLIGAADDFILVTTPEPTALTDAYGMLKVIAEQSLKDSCYVVVNLTRDIKEGNKSYHSLKKVSDQYLPGVKLHYLGDVRFDPVVSTAVHNFMPFILSRPRSSASLAVNRIAWRIAGRQSSEKDHDEQINSNFISRLLERS